MLVNLQINLIFILNLEWPLYPGRIIEMKRLSNDPQIKNAHSGYRVQAIGILTFLNQLGLFLFVILTFSEWWLACKST